MTRLLKYLCLIKNNQKNELMTMKKAHATYGMLSNIYLYFVDKKNLGEEKEKNFKATE